MAQHRSERRRVGEEVDVSCQSGEKEYRCRYVLMRKRWSTERVPIRKLILHRFGFRTHCRSFVGGSPFPQKSRKNGEIFEAGEQYPVPKPKTKQLTGEKRSCQ